MSRTDLPVISDILRCSIHGIYWTLYGLLLTRILVKVVNITGADVQESKNESVYTF